MNGTICAIINRRPVRYDPTRVIDVQVGEIPSVAASLAGSSLFPASTIDDLQALRTGMRRNAITLVTHATAPVKFYSITIGDNGHLFIIALHTRFGCKVRNADPPTQNKSAVDAWKTALTAHLDELFRDHVQLQISKRNRPEERSFSMHVQMKQMIRLAGNELHGLLESEDEDAEGALPEDWHQDKERWYNAFFLPYYALFFAVARATNTAAAEPVMDEFKTQWDKEIFDGGAIVNAAMAAVKNFRDKSDKREPAR